MITRTKDEAAFVVSYRVSNPAVLCCNRDEIEPIAIHAVRAVYKAVKEELNRYLDEDKAKDGVKATG
jgi:hypothetical protein